MAIGIRRFYKNPTDISISTTTPQSVGLDFPIEAGQTIFFSGTIFCLNGNDSTAVGVSMSTPLNTDIKISGLNVIGNGSTSTLLNFSSLTNPISANPFTVIDTEFHCIKIEGVVEATETGTISLTMFKNDATPGDILIYHNSFINVLLI